ncbi:hypothetical protein [Burkholderia gladioli]|uniref:hypothetical protein n=1 Tax=Burkholderia gladioli TaxID=28095 RepID=UPI001364C2C5|nr:hypothetical protein [Burkholderia gladioli]KAF1064912.1 hypothetical protein LvStA_03583 [Burkholderia gladioli]
MELTFSQQSGMNRYAEARDLVLEFLRDENHDADRDWFLRVFSARVIGYYGA